MVPRPVFRTPPPPTIRPVEGMDNAKFATESMRCVDIDRDASRRCHASSLGAFLHTARARYLHDCPPIRAGDLVNNTAVSNSELDA